jgi:AcrR family transcriptional regulator
VADTLAQNEKSDNTKRGIVEVATDLFIRNTYERTTIEDILKEWKGSKGSLYYHFESKEEILNAVVEALAEKEEKRIAEAISKDENDAVGMLNLFLAACLDRTPQLYDLEAEIYRSGNVTLSYRIAKLYIEKSIPFLEVIMRKGIEEGVFKIEYPAEMMEFALIIEEFVFKYPMFECGAEKYLRKISAYQSLLELMLGLEKGCLEQLSVFCQRIMENQRSEIHDKI